jgi:hypothetical protein
LTASPSGSCRACGAPAAKKEPLARNREEQQKDAKAPRGYQTTLLGVAMMISGILGSIVFSGAGVNGQLLVAGGLILGGVVLVVVGFLQSTWR